MIIKPQVFDKSGASSLGFVESYDTLWGRSFDKKRIACNSSGDIRVETIKIYPDDKYLVKECGFGKRISSIVDDKSKSLVDRVAMKNHMVSTIDLNTGKCVQFGSDCRSPSYDNTGWWLTAGDTSYEFEENGPNDTMTLNPNDTIYSTTKLSHCFTGFDLEAIKSSIYGTENLLQIGYAECIGLLSAFFTQCSYSFPFDSFVIIDTKYGFNVPNFKYFNIFDRDTGKKMYAEYIKSLSKVYDILKRNCELEKKDLRIFVFTSAYSTVIKIHDKTAKGLTMDLNLNASDHFSTIISNIENRGTGWTLSEECGSIIFNENGYITDEMTQVYGEDVESVF